VSRWYDRRSRATVPAFSRRISNIGRWSFRTRSTDCRARVRQNWGRPAKVNETGCWFFKNYQTNNPHGLLGDRQQERRRLPAGRQSGVGSSRHFHRGSASGTYGGVASDSLWHSTAEKGFVRRGETWTNGVSVNGTTTGLSGDYDLVSWRLSEADNATNGTPGAVWFASCYADSGGRLNGGQELAEVLIYTNRLSDAEIAATEHYLNRKWFPTRAGSSIGLGHGFAGRRGRGFVNAYTSARSR
jgi:hypothetical protein